MKCTQEDITFQSVMLFFAVVGFNLLIKHMFILKQSDVISYFHQTRLRL